MLLNCSDSDMMLNPLASNIYYRILTPIIMIIGLIGNLLGFLVIICGKREVKTVSEILNKNYFALNTVNCLLMLPWPLLDSYENFYKIKPFFEYRWNIYLIHYHFPLTMTLMDFGYLISVLISLDQYIAITIPFNYKRLCNLKNARWAIFVSFVYCLVWNIPSSQYLILKPIICWQSIIFARVPFVPQWPVLSKTWSAYNTLREVCTKIIPFIISIYFNSAVYIRRKPLFLLNTHTKMTSTKNSILYSKSIMKNHERNSMFPPLNLLTENNSSLLSTTTTTDNTHDRPNSKANDELMKHRKLKIKRIKEENIKNLKIMILLMVNFIEFFLPLTIFKMLGTFLMGRVNLKRFHQIFGGFIFLEYVYISGAFYVFMVFNSIYRRNIFALLKLSFR
ncbi:unnamed protein product [Gordionus sp. m RMFG-2023]